MFQLNDLLYVCFNYFYNRLLIGFAQKKINMHKREKMILALVGAGPRSILALVITPN